jgi:hypothetical protein
MSTEEENSEEKEEYYEDAEPEDIRYLYDSDDWLEEEEEWEAEFGDEECEDDLDC